MKTTILIAMLLVGNVVAGERPELPSFANVPPERPSFDIRNCDTTPGAVIPRSSAADLITKPVDPNVAWAASPSKVDYSIVTLPSGETASVLTFK
jgi:hypothetical protein